LPLQADRPKETIKIDMSSALLRFMEYPRGRPKCVCPDWKGKRIKVNKLNVARVKDAGGGQKEGECSTIKGSELREMRGIVWGSGGY
jgi:hypothetical protein